LRSGFNWMGCGVLRRCAHDHEVCSAWLLDAWPGTPVHRTRAQAVESLRARSTVASTRPTSAEPARPMAHVYRPPTAAWCGDRAATAPLVDTRAGGQGVRRGAGGGRG
jgi:hypothetical protein